MSDACSNPDTAVDQRRAEICVVGAGLAGLCVARGLVRRGCDVLVVEARSRVGGRILSHTLRDGARVDLGAQWVGPGQTRVLALAAELGAESYATHTAGSTRYEFMGRTGRCRGTVPLSEPLAVVGSGWGMLRLDRLCRSLRTQSAQQGDLASRLDEQSLGAWIQCNVWPRSARQLCRLMFQSLFCCDPDNVSLLLAVHCLSKCGSLDHMLKVDGGAQERQFVLGAQDLVERLGRELEAHVALSSPVKALRWDRDGAWVIGERFRVRARRVVMAIPPPLLARIDFTPELSEPRRRLVSQLRMGSVVKCAIVYDHPFWRERGLSGEAWSDAGPLTGTYDTSLPGSGRGRLTALASATHALELSALAPERRKQLVVAAVARLLGAPGAAPLEYVDQVWSDEPWTLGGFAAHAPAGAFHAGPTALSEPEGRLHWAGTETASSWPGYMEGAIESSERVLRELTESA